MVQNFKDEDIHLPFLGIPLLFPLLLVKSTDLTICNIE